MHAQFCNWLNFVPLNPPTIAPWNTQHYLKFSVEDCQWQCDLFKSETNNMYDCCCWRENDRRSGKMVYTQEMNTSTRGHEIWFQENNCKNIKKQQKRKLQIWKAFWQLRHSLTQSTYFDITADFHMYIWPPKPFPKKAIGSSNVPMSNLIIINFQSCSSFPKNGISLMFRIVSGTVCYSRRWFFPVVDDFTFIFQSLIALVGPDRYVAVPGWCVSYIWNCFEVPSIQWYAF